MTFIILDIIYRAHIYWGKWCTAICLRYLNATYIHSWARWFITVQVIVINMTFLSRKPLRPQWLNDFDVRTYT